LSVDDGAAHLYLSEPERLSWAAQEGGVQKSWRGEVTELRIALQATATATRRLGAWVQIRCCSRFQEGE